METESFTFVSDLFNLVKYLTGQVVKVFDCSARCPGSNPMSVKDFYIYFIFCVVLLLLLFGSSSNFVSTFIITFQGFCNAIWILYHKHIARYVSIH